jgi:hypothetical protein
MLVLLDHLVFVWMLLDDIKLVAFNHLFKLLLLFLKLGSVINVLLLSLLGSLVNVWKDRLKLKLDVLKDGKDMLFLLFVVIWLLGFFFD